MEGGDHLWRCLCYIELNLVRCGAVAHPREREWLGYHEIMGDKRRNCLLELERLCWRLGTESLPEVGRNLEMSLAERIARADPKREVIWTESVAAGSEPFWEQIDPGDVSRRRMEVVEAGENAWALRERAVPYGCEKGLKKPPMSQKPACHSAHPSIQ